MNIWCFYHDDLDGHCSAAIVKFLHPKVKLYEMSYKRNFPWDLVDKEDTIFMVDFSLKFEEMKQLASYPGLIWIDHHDSIINDMLASGLVS